jgi:hypothetical protein
MADIPEGYGIIAGRSSKLAQAALDAADAAGVERRLVKAVPEGYLVPDAVLKEWAEAHDVDLGDATTKADMLDAITASGTP